MADLSSTRVFGKLTVMHDAILKANAEIAGSLKLGQSTYAGDLDTAYFPGFYSTDENTANNPDNRTVTGLIVTSDSIRTYQLQMTADDDLRFRNRNNSWGNWKTVYHSGNKPTSADVGLGSVDNYSRAHYDGRYAYKSHSHNETQLNCNQFYWGGGNHKLYNNDGSGNSGITFGGNVDTATETGRPWKINVNNDSTRGDFTIQRASSSVSANSSIPWSTILNLKYNGNAVFEGNVTAFSDIRVKTNIDLIPDALDKVSRLSGYTFDRTDTDVPRQTGVIAQEVLEVLPEAVLGGPTEDDPEGHYSVAYGNMVGLLIEAIKEESSKREALEGRLVKLEALVGV